MASNAVPFTGGAFALLLTTSAVAGPYVDVNVGLNHARDETFVDNGTPVGSMDYQNGWLGSLGVGYAFPVGLRTELELAHRDNRVDSFEPSTAPASGTHRAETVIAGLWYDLPFARAVHPSIGIGAGRAEIGYRHLNNVHNVDRSDGDNVFAWQAGAGLRYDLGSRLSVMLGYRHLETGKAAYHLDPVNAPYVSDAILAGLRVSLGPAPEAAPVPVAAEPEPPPQVEVAAFETVVLRPVNFRFDRSALTEPARVTLDDVANILTQYPDLRVMIEGHCDFIGTHGYNDALGMRRAVVVRDYLVMRGVPADQLELTSYGKRQPAADNRTRDGRAENRRVKFSTLDTPDNLEMISDEKNDATWRAAHGPEDPLPDPPGTPPEHLP